MFNKLLTYGFIYILCSWSAIAQQNTIYSQYMFNMAAINPAYIGIHDALDITALHRTQWTGIEGHPTTQTLTANTPLHNELLAVGATLYRDAVGINRDLGMLGQFSYKIKLNEKWVASFGLQAGIINYKSDFGSLASDAESLDDQSFNNFISTNSILPVFGSGVLIYSERGFFGFSVPHITDKNLLKSAFANSFLGNDVREYFLNMGYVFDVNYNLKVRPTLLLRASENGTAVADFGALGVVNDVLWFGMNYRTFSSINLMLQAQLNDQLKVGYNYDINLNSLNDAVNSVSTHEIMLNYILQYYHKKVPTPRYF